MRGVRIGRIAGIDVHIDWSLLTIFFLINFSLAAGVFPSWHPDWSPGLAWTTALEDIMTPETEVEQVSPDDDAADAMSALGRRGVNQMPVIEGGRLQGLLRREDILKWLSLYGGGDLEGILPEARQRQQVGWGEGRESRG